MPGNFGKVQLQFLFPSDRKRFADLYLNIFSYPTRDKQLPQKSLVTTYFDGFSPRYFGDLLINLLTAQVHLPLKILDECFVETFRCSKSEDVRSHNLIITILLSKDV